MKYTCALCGKEFVSEWSEEDALSEVAQNFPGYDKSECDVVCDDCYKQFAEEK